MDLSAKNLRMIVDEYVANNDVGNITCPPGIAAVAKYITSLLPQYKKGTSKLVGGGEEGTFHRRRRDDFVKAFPPGTCTFVIPNEDVTVCPSPHYRAVEGMTICIGRWDIQVPDLVLKCPEIGCDGVISVSERYIFVCFIVLICMCQPC